MIKMMVVDDSNIIRNKIKRSCDLEEFEIVANAQDGIEAISKFRRLRPQLVTMDLTMPNMDGIECITHLVAIDSTVQILVISALSDQDTGIEALQSGASGFLLKPFSEQELRDALIEIKENLNV